MMPLLVLLGMVLMQTPGRLQPGTGIVSGTVRTSDGGPAGGIRVAAMPVDDPTGSNFLSIAETDSAGRYRLSSIPEGRYYIVAGRVNAPTYYPGGTDRSGAGEVVVESARVRTSVDFTLAAASRRPPSPLSPPTIFGQDESSAFSRSLSEKSPDTRIKLLLDFERNFPQSGLLADARVTLMDLYAGKGDARKALEYGEKSLKSNPQDVTILVRVSQRYATLHTDLDKALEYAERAVTAVSRMKSQPAAPPYTPKSWAEWVASLDSSVKSNLTWVKQIASRRQDVLNSLLVRKR